MAFKSIGYGCCRGTEAKVSAARVHEQEAINTALERFARSYGMSLEEARVKLRRREIFIVDHGDEEKDVLFNSPNGL